MVDSKESYKFDLKVKGLKQDDNKKATHSAGKYCLIQCQIFFDL